MGENYLHFIFIVFMGFFAIMNPIANAPVFMGLVNDYSHNEKKEIAKKACITAFIIVISFILFGKNILALFGLSIPAFRIAGGIIIFYVGFEMLQSKKSSIHSNKEIDHDSSIAISPLAIPILAGPGTIVTAMNFATKGDIIHLGIIIAVFAIILIMTYLSFTLSEALVRIVGTNILIVISKVMGLILSIMGTGMVIEGIKLAFKLT